MGLENILVLWPQGKLAWEWGAGAETSLEKQGFWQQDLEPL